MRLWLITFGEPIPEVDAAGDRQLRTGIVARMAAARGHQVTWWTSTFDHARKRQRVDRDTDLSLGPGLCIRMLHAPGYQRNVSVSRLWNHRAISRAFRRLAPGGLPPDVIVCSMPTLEVSVAAVEYGRERGVPVVLDVRDMWPDIFLDLVPRWARSPGRLLLAPYFHMAQRSCRMATAVIGITDEVVGWALRYAGREKGERDRSFPLGYERTPPPADAIARAEEFWAQQGIGKAPEFIVCYFGAIGNYFEGETVVEAARYLHERGGRVRFVICGTGDRMEAHRARAAGLPNVMFTGWIGAAEIWVLMRMATVGLAPYVSAGGFTMSVPNKVIEYLSAGLPIVSSLQGTLAQMLADCDCGITYPNRNAEALASTLSTLANHPARAREMSRKALALYERDFVADSVYGAMLDHLESIARRPIG